MPIFKWQTSLDEGIQPFLIGSVAKGTAQNMISLARVKGACPVEEPNNLDGGVVIQS